MAKMILRRLAALLAIVLLLSDAALAQLAVQGSTLGLSTTNSSVTITTGNSFQTVLAASTSRRSLTIQNNNTNTDNCWVFIGSGTATKATSIILSAGGSYQRYWPNIPSDTIQATCASTSDSLYVDTQ